MQRAFWGALSSAFVVVAGAPSAVSLHSIFVSATDRSGQFVSAVNPRDLVVKEDGQRRTIVDVHQPRRAPRSCSSAKKD